MTCTVCGYQGRTGEVSPGLIQRSDDGKFESVPLCRDHRACSERVRAQAGDPVIQPAAIQEGRGATL